jgi:hypothetical protein
MRKIGQGLPLTFLLAMGVHGADRAADVLDYAAPLQPGMLAPLVPKSVDAPENPTNHTKDDVTDPPRPIAQFFNFPNFPNCFVGNFRRC